MWYIYTIKYYSAIKKLKIAICSNMDRNRDYQNKSERQISYDIIYMQNPKKGYK